MTFIEILVATAIIALVAGILLTTFGFSFRHMREAEKVLSATFVAQRKIEMLQGMDALSVFNEGRGQRQQFMDKCVEVVCRPYMPQDCYAFYVMAKDVEGASAVVYIVPYDNSGVLYIPVVSGGKTINISISDSGYSIASPGYETLKGGLPNDSKKIVVVVNGVVYSQNYVISINISSAGRAAEARVYDAGGNTSHIAVNGLGVQVRRYSGYVYRDYSTVKAQVRVFENEGDIRPAAVFESILELKY